MFGLLSPMLRPIVSMPSTASCMSRMGWSAGKVAQMVPFDRLNGLQHRSLMLECEHLTENPYSEPCGLWGLLCPALQSSGPSIYVTYPRSPLMSMFAYKPKSPQTRALQGPSPGPPGPAAQPGSSIPCGRCLAKQQGKESRRFRA